MKPSEILTSEVIEPKWIVRDMLPRNTMIILAGEAGAGKSTLCYALSYCIASGHPFLGHATEPTKILYFDEENSYPDFLQYNQWVWVGLGCPEPKRLDELLRIEHMSLINGWKEKMQEIIMSYKPGLVIIDTATPALHIKDENDNSEALRVIRQLRVLQKYGDDTTFLVLKHEKQRSDIAHRRTIRGAKSWLGAFDQVLFHVIAPGARRRRDGTRLTRLEPEKLRAYSLKHEILIDPSFSDTTPKGLILQGTPIYAPEKPDKKKT